MPNWHRLLSRNYVVRRRLAVTGEDRLRSRIFDSAELFSTPYFAVGLRTESVYVAHHPGTRQCKERSKFTTPGIVGANGGGRNVVTPNKENPS